MCITRVSIKAMKLKIIKIVFIYQRQECKYKQKPAAYKNLTYKNLNGVII